MLYDMGPDNDLNETNCLGSAMLLLSTLLLLLLFYSGYCAPIPCGLKGTKAARRLPENFNAKNAKTNYFKTLSKQDAVLKKNKTPF